MNTKDLVLIVSAIELPPIVYETAKAIQTAGFNVCIVTSMMEPAEQNSICDPGAYLTIYTTLTDAVEHSKCTHFSIIGPGDLIDFASLKAFIENLWLPDGHAAIALTERFYPGVLARRPIAIIPKTSVGQFEDLGTPRDLFLSAAFVLLKSKQEHRLQEWLLHAPVLRSGPTPLIYPEGYYGALRDYGAMESWIKRENISRQVGSALYAEYLLIAAEIAIEEQRTNVSLSLLVGQTPKFVTTFTQQNARRIWKTAVVRKIREQLRTRKGL